ncbi:hypothetical protein HY500_04595 [Candidatus Woesearchaeota archaeon]|nr:hypothetical protein [Candidatus Woesearchaeota archaeon]
MKFYVFFILMLLFIGGCTKSVSENISLNEECINSCKGALKEGRNLENGPCLLNPMKNKDWVCDVAHNPRQEVDDISENQCNSYKEHFIEVDPNCNFIVAY